MELFFFYVFATILLWSAVMVISNKNAVHAVLYLVLVFCANSCILLLLGTDFLALILLVVYIGAIAILFLFVVMLLPIKQQTERTFLQDLPIGFFIGIVLCLFVLYIIGSDIPTEILKNYSLESSKLKIVQNIPYTEIRQIEYFIPTETLNMPNILHSKETINVFGFHLYDTYFYYTLLAGLILLLALMGSVVLAGKNKKIKNQLAYQQISRRAEKAILKIKI